MRPGYWYSYVAMGAVVTALAVGAMPLVVSPFVTQGAPIGTVVASNVYYVNLTISGVGAPATFFYSPHAAEAPTHFKVVFNIVNHDTRVGSLPAPVYAQVLGTLGGYEIVSMGTNTGTMTGLPTKMVSHTFTMLAGTTLVNAPIPPMLNNVPTKVSFTMVFNFPGNFGWSCVVLYGGPPNPGLTGTLQVR
ncbi:MAG TPA: hypothetical protein VEY07_02210 [Thermoplasmata archaeon]|nr:hypothetical protein [Thermoplasmata archaeon]